MGSTILCDLIVSLREEGKLSLKNESEQETNKEPKLICSMGIVKNEPYSEPYSESCNE